MLPFADVVWTVWYPAWTAVHLASTDCEDEAVVVDAAAVGLGVNVVTVSVVVGVVFVRLVVPVVVGPGPPAAVAFDRLEMFLPVPAISLRRPMVLLLHYLPVLP